MGGVFFDFFTGSQLFRGRGMPVVLQHQDGVSQ